MQSAIERIKNDLKQIKVASFCDSIAGIERQSNDPLIVRALLVTTTSSKLKEDVFTVTMQFPDNYPCSPPTIKIVAEIDDDFAQLMEASMAELLQANWAGMSTTEDIFNLMLDLLHGNGLRAAV